MTYFHFMHFKNFTLSLLTSFMVLVELPAATQNTVIWKLDDVRAGEKARLPEGFKRVVDWAQKNKTFVNFGVICDSLTNPDAQDVAWIKKNAVENGGQVEFWLHGWDHKKSGDKASEFLGSDLVTQTKHLRDACDIFNKTTGLTFHAFGAPYNQFDDNTLKALDACPELKIFMFGSKKDTKRKVIARSINMEVATGKVSYDAFVKAYADKKPTGLLLLQGHCGQWDDKSFNDFVMVAEFLRKEGWVTKTVSQAVE